MLRSFRLNIVGPLSLLALFLSGCAETQLAVHAAKKLDYEEKPQASVGAYKVGKPYQIAGVWYYPKEDYDYVETGVASWYGPGFHGRRTANGEIFDQNGVTAAHRTLPLPTFVRVTNLENGRSLKIRINDRGPFANGRIIDLSRRGAQLLGFERKGTAKVRVEILEPESRLIAARAKGEDPGQAAPQAVPVETVTAQVLSPVSGAGELEPKVVADAGPTNVQSAARVVPEPVADGRVTRQPVARSDLFIQAGAFVQLHNAVRLKARLSPLGPSRIVEARVGNRDYFRVQLGPFARVEEADKTLSVLIANGITNAKIAVD